MRLVSVDSNPERVGVISNDDKELDGRQGPAEAPPKTIGKIKAVNRILTNKVSVLKERISLDAESSEKGICYGVEYIELYG